MTAHPLTLTVNDRLARWLLLEQDEQKRNAGVDAWETPPILPLSSWLENVWRESWPEKYLISPLQCEKIWEEIIKRDAAELKLLHLQGVAAQASKAFSLLHEYRLPRNSDRYEQTAEAKAFLRWTKKYDRRVASMNALDSATLMDAVRNSMQDGTIPFPPQLRVMGFEEQNPQLKYFLDFLEENGTRVDFVSPVPDSKTLAERLSDENQSVNVREYEHRQSEVEACARWVRSIFQPGKRIGIVVPELEKYRALLKRELAAELVPKIIFNLDEQDLPFNISLAPPLSQEPMIKLALNLLNVKTSAVPVNIFLSVIQSPFFGFAFPPTIDISNLERRLRKKRMLAVPLEPSTYNSVPQVNQLVAELKSWTRNDNKLTPEKWAKESSEFLKTVGWPGKSATAADGDDKNFVLSKRHQAFEAWKDCLNQLSSLNQILGRISRHEALNHLTHITRRHLFQSKTPEHSIQIIGLLESSGMKFDHLWVMGCQSETLPAHPEPNPFIPYEIRNEHSIPRSNPQRELKFAEQSVHRLLMAAPDVHLSFSLHEGDMNLEMSPLLKQFAADEKVAHQSNRIKDQVLRMNQLEEFTESAFLPVTVSEENQFGMEGVPSGYALIKDQADCPFRAFARHRLNSQRYPSPEIDFDNLDRGNLIHKAMELFWSKTSDQKNLFDLSNRDDELEKRVEQCVQKALEICSERTAGQSQFHKLEIERNVHVIREWIREVELKRPEFKVLRQEESISVNLSGLKLRLRIDRVDEISDDGLLLIDYKTGKDAKPRDWFKDDEIRSPQLPLYAVASRPVGIAYGHLAIDKPKMKGAADADYFSSKKITSYKFENPKPLSWEKWLDNWKDRLTDVADEFLRGNHQVAPINKGEPCRHCEFGSLCRIQETGKLAAVEDEP